MMRDRCSPFFSSTGRETSIGRRWRAWGQWCNDFRGSGRLLTNKNKQNTQFTVLCLTQPWFENSSWRTHRLYGSSILTENFFSDWNYRAIFWRMELLNIKWYRIYYITLKEKNFYTDTETIYGRDYNTDLKGQFKYEVCTLHIFLI